MTQMPMKLFYLLATILFGIGMLGMLYTTVMKFGLYDIGQKISSITNIIFNVLLTIVFGFMWKATPSQKKEQEWKDMSPMDDDDFELALKELKSRENQRPNPSQDDLSSSRNMEYIRRHRPRENDYE